MRQWILRTRWMAGASKHTTRMDAHERHVVTALQFDDEYIVTGSDDHKVKVWSTSSKRQIRTIEGHQGGVWAMQFSGNRLVTGATDRRLHVYNLRTGECIHQLRGHESTIRCLQVTAGIGKTQEEGG